MNVGSILYLNLFGKTSNYFRVLSGIVQSSKLDALVRFILGYVDVFWFLHIINIQQISKTHNRLMSYTSYCLKIIYSFFNQILLHDFLDDRSKKFGNRISQESIKDVIGASKIHRLIIKFLPIPEFRVCRIPQVIILIFLYIFHCKNDALLHNASILRQYVYCARRHIILYYLYY